MYGGSGGGGGSLLFGSSGGGGGDSCHLTYTDRSTQNTWHSPHEFYRPDWGVCPVCTGEWAFASLGNFKNQGVVYCS